MTTSHSKKILEELSEELSEDAVVNPTALFTDDVVERAYIGGSSIGSECERKIAMRLRGFPVDKRSSRETRVLEMGHVIERVIVKKIKSHLAKKGEAKLIKTGELLLQLKVEYYGEVARAFGDGVIKIIGSDERILFEAKSTNNDSYNLTKRIGVKYAHKEYYDQVQFIMGLSGINQTYLVMMNKDNSAIYTEVIDFDETIFHYLCARVEYIAKGLDDRVSEKPSFFCMTCDYTNACWKPEPIPLEHRTCRHCVNSYMDDEKDSFVKCSVGELTEPLKTHYSQVEKTAAAVGCLSFKDRRDI